MAANFRRITPRTIGDRAETDRRAQAGGQGRAIRPRSASSRRDTSRSARRCGTTSAPWWRRYRSADRAHVSPTRACLGWPNRCARPRLESRNGSDGCRIGSEGCVCRRFLICLRRIHIDNLDSPAVGRDIGCTVSQSLKSYTRVGDSAVARRVMRLSRRASIMSAIVASLPVHSALPQASSHSKRVARDRGRRRSRRRHHAALRRPRRGTWQGTDRGRADGQRRGRRESARRWSRSWTTRRARIRGTGDESRGGDRPGGGKPGLRHGDLVHRW